MYAVCNILITRLSVSLKSYATVAIAKTPFILQILRLFPFCYCTTLSAIIQGRI